MQVRLTIEILRSGQPRAYADHHMHARATFEMMRGTNNGNEWGPHDHFGEEQVRAMLRAHPFSRYTDVTEYGWTPFMTSFHKTAPGVWEYHVTTLYTG